MKCTDTLIKRSIPGKVSLNYDRDGKLMAHTRTKDSCPDSESKILNKCSPMSFQEIKSIANRQESKQEQIIFSDSLQTKMVNGCS